MWVPAPVQQISICPTLQTIIWCLYILCHVLYNWEDRDRQFPRDPSTDLAIVIWHTVQTGGIELRDGFVAQWASGRTRRCGPTVVGPTAVDATVPVPTIADPTIADPTIVIPTAVGKPLRCPRLPTAGWSAVSRPLRRVFKRRARSQCTGYAVDTLLSRIWW